MHGLGSAGFPSRRDDRRDVHAVQRPAGPHPGPPLDQSLAGSPYGTFSNLAVGWQQPPPFSAQPSQLLSPVQEQRGWPHNAIPGSDPVLLRPSRMTAWKSSCRHLSYEVHGLPIKCCDSARRAFIPDSSLALTSSRRHLSCQVQAPHINVIILPGATGNVTALHWSCRACGKEWRMLWCTGCGLGETGASTALLSGTYSELHLTYA